MPANRETVLCRYHYDPLDRLVGTSPTRDAELLRFYCKNRFATEILALQHSIFQQNDQLQAQHRREGNESGHFSLLKKPDSFLNIFRKKTTHFFSSTFKTNKPKLFNNSKPQDRKPEFQNYEQLMKAGPSQKIPVRTISTAQDLELLLDHNYSGNFIFTDQRQLVVGDHANHSALSEFAGTSNVISAGKLRVRQGRFIIENASGHYWPSFKSLIPVREHLEGIGVQVELIRFTKSRYVGPLRT